MRGPTPVLDYLTQESTNSFLPLPQLADPLDGVVGLDDVARSMIQANLATNNQALELYHGRVKKAWGDFYVDVAKASLELDNNLTLTSELIGHTDGVLTDLARTKLLSLFKGRARSAIYKKLRETRQKEEDADTREPVKGLCGGDSEVKESLTEVVKGDDIVAKVLERINFYFLAFIF